MCKGLFPAWTLAHRHKRAAIDGRGLLSDGNVNRFIPFHFLESSRLQNASFSQVGMLAADTPVRRVPMDVSVLSKIRLLASERGHHAIRP